MGYKDYKACIEACLHCASACNYCASECLQENDVAKMAKCVQMDNECAAICYCAAQLMSMGSTYAPQLCKLCADICEACGKECGKHDTEHCKACAEACRECADACRALKV